MAWAVDNRVTWIGLRHTIAGMAPDDGNQIDWPQPTPEQLDRERALLARLADGDRSGTVDWDDLADELGLPH
jgi:hypothetical protein